MGDGRRDDPDPVSVDDEPEVLASNVPGAYSEAVGAVAGRGIALSDAEVEQLGVAHAAIGACLLALWAIPDAIVEAAGCHHVPGRTLAGGFGVLEAVHVADVLAHELYPEHVIGAPSVADLVYLEELGRAARRPVWREAAAVAEEATCAAGSG